MTGPTAKSQRLPRHLEIVSSVYPSIRWNYLPTADYILGDPRSTFAAAVCGRSSAVAALYQESRRVPDEPDRATSGQTPAAESALVVK